MPDVVNDTGAGAEGPIVRHELLICQCFIYILGRSSHRCLPFNIKTDGYQSFHMAYLLPLYTFFVPYFDEKDCHRNDNAEDDTDVQIE